MEILIADDSAVSRRLLEAELAKWGYRVVAVASGAEAWEILQKEDAPRLVILDWMMPGLSGPEVCRLVRQQSKGYYTYILLLTSRKEKGDLIAGMEAGADDYLVKPFDQNELKVRLGPGRRIIELQEELWRAQEALRELALRDSLTKVWNRHAIFEFLTTQLARCQREQASLGIVMGDLDRFKGINDTHGHVAGDQVLIEVVTRMKQCIRPYDSIGRYGGEEFLLILPGCDGEGSRQTAERMREQIEQGSIRAGEACIRVTTSFGVTALPRGRESSPEALIRLADKALYLAKEQGRNRTVYLALD